MDRKLKEWDSKYTDNMKKKEIDKMILNYLNKLNREEFKKALAFDRVKLVRLIDLMINTRYCYT